ncbi:MAG: DNA primase [Chloroflexi bacterium]|nr:DNA primase [Chloroflexota bacterium]MDA1002004.1 DNA primase [Chloroflexota bacterium]
MSTIDEVKARLDIVETVGQYVPDLKKSGRTYKARCPFHQERTPSFVVDSDRGTWHCFGACSTGGDVIEFVRRVEGLDFKEALRTCADRAGIELRPPSKRDIEEREQHERLLQANEAAAVYFQAALRGPQGGDARAYLEGRGLDAEALETWQLGYAPEGWRGLIDHLSARGFAEPDLVASGLAIEGDRGAYDRFRDRVIFPTRDARRRLIGFGARALRPDDEPKYLNTPQTPLFDKSGTLYGLDRGAEAIRRADRAIIVEGYMDVIAAHQFGIENVVASNGTAITEKQIGLLARFTNSVVLVLDADAAGSEAARRGGPLAETALGPADRERLGVVADRNATDRQAWQRSLKVRDLARADVRVSRLPKGEDPDSLVRKDPDLFKGIVDSASPAMDFVFDAATDGLDLDDPRARAGVLEALAPFVAAMENPVIRSHYVQKLARIGQVDEHVVMRMIARGGRPRPVQAPGAAASATGSTAPRRAAAAVTADGETQLLRVLVQRRDARGAGLGVAPDTFEDSLNRALFEWWAQSPDVEDRLEELDQDLHDRYDELYAATLPPFDPRHVDDMVRDIAGRVRLMRTQKRLLSVAVEQAEAVRALRRGPAQSSEDDDMREQFEETTVRQRELTREYQRIAGRHPTSADAAPDLVEEAR